MKMKVVDAIRKTGDEQIAKIIGAVILQSTDGISAEEAIKLDYPNTLKELQLEIEIDYKPTNADRIRSMSDEELADFIYFQKQARCSADCIGVDTCYYHADWNGECGDTCEQAIKRWLQSEAEEEKS